MATIKNLRGRAAVVVESWCSSWNIPVRQAQKSEIADLVVGNKLVRFSNVLPPPGRLDDGNAICDVCGIVTNIDRDFGYLMVDNNIVPQTTCKGCRKPPANDKDVTVVVLNARRVADTNVDTKLAEIYKLTRALGIQNPGGARTDHYSERTKTADYEGVAMRLTQFQRSPNPPDAILAKYEPLVRKEAQRFAGRYHVTLEKMSQDWRDLHSIGMIYFINHWAEYREGGADSLNEKFLAHSLRQQFSRWNTVTWAKLKNQDFSSPGVPIGELASGPNGANVSTFRQWDEATNQYEVTGSYEIDVFVDEDDVHLDENDGERIDRRRASRKALEAGLKAMPHEKFLSTLQDVVGSEFQDYYARRLAGKLLKEHQVACPECLSKVNEQAS